MNVIMLNPVYYFKMYNIIEHIVNSIVINQRSIE